VHKWIGLILIIIGTQVVAADGNEPKVVYVKESKSLWSVALSVKPTEVRMWQAVMALYERNPDAFYNNDVNKLKDNVALVVPSTEVMLSVTEVEALARFQLLGDQPQSDLDKVTLDTPSMPLVDLTSNISLTAPIIPVPDNTQESTEDKAQNLTTLNQEDETPVEQSCLLLKCNPKGNSVVDVDGFGNVGDFYVSIGASKLNDNSFNSTSAFIGDNTIHLNGEMGFEANVGYLWRDGVVLELGYHQSNSEFYSVTNSTRSWNYGKGYPHAVHRKTELISPKVIFGKDIAQNMTVYSGLGVGWNKDTYSGSVYNIQTQLKTIAVLRGSHYQMLLGSKLHLTENVFIDLRVQNKYYLGRGASDLSDPIYSYSTVDTTISIGMDL
jgi:FimV-like protein